MQNSVWHNLRANPNLIFSLALVLALVFSALLFFSGLPSAIIYSGIFLAMIVVVVLYYNPFYSMVIFLISGFLLFFLVQRVFRAHSIPLGIILDALNFFTLITLFLKGELKGTKSYIGTLLIIWFLICTVQLVNPFATSRPAWFHAMRHVFNQVSPFFIIYSLFISGKKVLKPLIYLWIGLCTLTALYTFYQEHVGLPPWDYRYMHMDEQRVKLFTTFGRIRKFSFTGNPTENGILLCTNCLLCFGLAITDNIKNRARICFFLLFIISFLAMSYTGTRTATIMFVVGIVLYVLIRKKRELWIGALIGSFLLVGYVVKTGGGGAMSVMTTAFNEDDPSLQVRFRNQQTLRKFLYKSPIGYGMGSSGFLARKYSPYTVLSKIPPDSELVRVIVEVGFTGLMFYLFMHYKFLARASENLSNHGGDFTNNFKVITTAMIFIIILGHYPQQIMIINPLKILMGTLIAYINLTPEEAEHQAFL